MSEPVCEVLIAHGAHAERCEKPGVARFSTGFWHCPEHTTLAPGWRLVRESEEPALLREAYRHLDDTFSETGQTDFAALADWFQRVRPVLGDSGQEGGAA